MFPCRVHRPHFNAKLWWQCEWLTINHQWSISAHTCFCFSMVQSLLVLNYVTTSTHGWDASVRLSQCTCCAVAADTKEALTTWQFIDWSLTLLLAWPVRGCSRDLFGLQTKRYMKWTKREIHRCNYCCIWQLREEWEGNWKSHCNYSW